MSERFKHGERPPGISGIQVDFSDLEKVLDSLIEDSKTPKWTLSKGTKLSDILLYKWVSNNTIWIQAPGASKSNVETLLTDGKLNVKWCTKFTKADIDLKVPENTNKIDIEVVYGMIVVNFITIPSSISIEIK